MSDVLLKMVEEVKNRSVSGEVEGLEVLEKLNEKAEYIDKVVPVDNEVAEDALSVPRVQIGAVEEKSDDYGFITIEGLRKYRPDLIDIIESSRPKRKNKSSSKLPDDPIDKFIAYYKLAIVVAKDENRKFTKKRLNFLNAFYIEALKHAGVELSENVNVEFVVNNETEINASWSGVKPKLPDQLNY